MSRPKITLRTSDGDQTYDIREGEVLFAGRTSECDICLPTPAVSRRHAIIIMRGGKCGIKDLDSGNGTFVNGKRLTRPVKLRDGDVIQIATHKLEFSIPKTTPLAEALPYQKAHDTLLLKSDDAPVETGGKEPETVPQEPAAAPEADTPEPQPSDPPPAVAAEAEAGATDQDQFDPTLSGPPPAPDEGTADEPAARSDTQGRQRVDEKTVRRVRDSMAMTPKAPPAPKMDSEAGDDEIGDGAGDTGLWVVIPNEAEAETPVNELAIAKAAADAGLVGDFEPEPAAEASDSDLLDIKETLDAADDDDGAKPEDSAQADDDTDAVPPGESFGPGVGMLPLPPEEANPDAIPLTGDFRRAIESRLFYYSFMEDLRREREEILATHPDAADAVKSEVDRQNREMAKPPKAEQAEDRIAKVNARRDALREKIKEAKEKGTAMPPRPSKLMREVEDIGINQWTIISQSLKEALPGAFEAGYVMVKDEPLAKVLEEAEIDGRRVLGGAAYCLALEVLLAEAKFNRAVLKERIAETPPPDEKKSGGMFSRFSKKDDDDDEDEEEGNDEGEYDAMVEDERLLGLRCAWITQESAYVEEMLIKEFWDVYLKVALRYIPEHQGMPLCVRAFLRYGVVGFSRWWLPEPVRAFITDDCTNEVRHTFEVGSSITNVCYAEEYLAAVMELRCTPAMDENLEINEKNSPNWKADKALRKLINAKAQTIRLGELSGTLTERIDKLDQESTALEERINNLIPGQKNFKQVKNELGQERQALRIEISKLRKLAEKLEEQINGELKETVEETEARFESGEIPKPTPEFLIEREVGQIRRIGRLTANLKEKLLPLAMREYPPNTDAANDRLSIIGELADIERRDPRLFLETLVPSKKKANRVDVRISPVIVLTPSAGVLAFSWNPRQKPEDGRLALPTFFTRQRIRERQMTYLMSDFRWDTAKASAGMDLMNSETIVAEFMRVRWDWRKRSREMREKGLVYTEQNDRTNWRRVYEAYLSTAYDGGKKLFNRNYNFYEQIIGKYFDMPENVELLRKQ